MTVLLELVRAVAAVVLAVAEQPVGDAAVVGPARTPRPAGRAVALPVIAHTTTSARRRVAQLASRLTQTA